MVIAGSQQSQRK